MDGDIDKALKRTHAYYPDVLRNNTKIYFQLKCRKFIEMLRHTAEILDLPNREPSSKIATNGQSSNGEKDASSHRMDIDDQQEDINENSDAGDSDKEQQYHESLQYGQELKLEFRDQKSPYYHDKFEDLFSLFAYPDPRTSPMSHLFGESGALAVAEELNSVILGK